LRQRDQGVIFKANLDGSGFTVLHHFSGASDGQYPFGSLIINGKILYGMTPWGGGREFWHDFQI
jgi:hypothetical protein